MSALQRCHEWHALTGLVSVQTNLCRGTGYVGTKAGHCQAPNEKPHPERGGLFYWVFDLDNLRRAFGMRTRLRVYVRANLASARLRLTNLSVGRSEHGRRCDAKNKSALLVEGVLSK